MPPGIVFVIDLVAFTLSLSCHQAVSCVPSLAVSPLRFVGATFAIGLIVLLVHFWEASGESIDDGLFLNGRYMVAEPDVWLNHRFPLLPYIDVGTKLSSGEWDVVLYRPDCPSCDALLQRLRDQGLSEFANDGARLALVSLAGDFKARVAFPSGNTQLGELTSSYEWIMHTPLLLKVSNGNVVQVLTRDE